MNDDPLEPASVRLPARLFATIRRQAKQNRRSLNSEIIVLLERALPGNEKAEVAVTTPAQ